MELVSGYRDRIIEFSEAMAHWYRCFQTTRRGRKEPHSDFWGYDFPRYHMDRSPYWILHLLDYAAPPPAVIPRLEQAGVDPSELMSSDGESVLMVTDASGLPLGFDVLAGGWAGSLGGGEAAGGDGKGALETIQKMVGLLRRCMEAPMTGGLPRRPHMLHVNDKKLHRLLSRCEKALTILKVVLWPQALGDWGLTEVEQVDGGESFSMRWPPTCYCHVCKKHSFPSQLKPCPQCKAVLYCSDQCSQTDQIRCPEDTSHQHWCEKLSRYMSHDSQLAELPFSYAAEVTAVDFDLEHFLNKNKLDSGYWVHWSLLVRSPRYELHPTVEQSRDQCPHWFTGHSEPFGPLKREGDILLCSPAPHAVPSVTKPLVLWSQYCEWRGISLSSPAAVLLSSPLSIYYIITSLVPKDFPELNIQKKQSLKIHIIDSYREFHCLKVFWELSILLPHMTFELVFIGEGLPPESDEEQLFLQKKDGCVDLVNPSFAPDEKLDRRSIRVKGYRRAYHMLQGPKPDLVIGFRPAIQLQESWLSTLPRLQSLRVPAYFCEVGELSCECSQQVMSQATGGTLSPPHVNPFHCPLRITGGDNMLPWYSNAFIFHLRYKPLHSEKRPSVAYPKAPPLQVEPANQEPDYPVKMSRRDRKQAARNMPRKRK
ncbi:zinc finger MYND domain-containing protein 15 isoform X2 [Salmo salar]|uniref:Zinc finger MYND domain-containing protein 15 isoform X2 n=1 Tax=Salmo salar TaxID=8030 RepID=A0A1S3SC77_SALSA|nr:zinc finger MYND domain-containing protein 15 isoform X2 [Salmo salar]|eukprot:XP_014061944.1 PREDICTED: zinc finger MYND domain-containing protein 15 isoform X2 [Salmo salar]